MRVEEYIPVASIQVDRLPGLEASLPYAIALAAGTNFPPIKVACSADGSFEIRNGRHRLMAHKLLGRETVLARFGRRALRRASGNLRLDPK